MNNKTLIIKEITRFPQHGDEDKLTFQPGVNVIVGAHNTGKTKWFQMIDYLFGQEKSPENVFGEELSEKYESAQMILLLAGEEVTIERRWKEGGVRSKVFINNEPYSVKDYWYFLMEKLEIPVLHYPQGNPMGSRAWPELSWRSLFRHIYRRQKFWTDFADKQPESEQYACLVQFLGIAANLFSEQFKELVSKERQIMQLQAVKDQYVSMLQEVSKEIIDEEEVGVALTPQSIKTALKRIEGEVKAVEDHRNAVVAELINTAVTADTDEETHTNRANVQQLGEEQAELNVNQERIQMSLQKTESRLQEMRSYRGLVADELSRMSRASDAGSILANLKITHCPVCDREVLRKDFVNECYLCHRSVDNDDEFSSSTSQRLEFELEQLTGELSETDQLIERLANDVDRLKNELNLSEAGSARLEQLLKPTRSAITAILPPELMTTDVKIGQLQERYQQLQRIEKTLQRRENISDEINEIRETLADLEVAINEQSRLIDFERSGDILTDGMNTYLNFIKSSNPNSWTQEEILFRLNDRKFTVKVGGSHWASKLGGTLTLYFLIAYHYALMSMTTRPECNYPGLLLLDFPAELQDASTVADKENFIIEPFVDFTACEGMESTQVIAGGSSFENLEGANRIEFYKIWQ
jgi:hypothetical protein